MARHMRLDRSRASWSRLDRTVTVAGAEQLPRWGAPEQIRPLQLTTGPPTWRESLVETAEPCGTRPRECRTTANLLDGSKGHDRRLIELGVRDAMDLKDRSGQEIERAGRSGAAIFGTVAVRRSRRPRHSVKGAGLRIAVVTRLALDADDETAIKPGATRGHAVWYTRASST
jgi:hypothetical protein